MKKDLTLSGNMLRTKELLIESTFIQGTSFGKKRVTVLSTIRNCLHSDDEDENLPVRLCGATKKLKVSGRVLSFFGSKI